MSNKDPLIAKRNIISSWRRRKSLCLRCGQDVHTGDCVEIYDKADMRKSDIIKKSPNIDKQKETIISYRKRKLLCLRCGQMVHTGECDENYSKSDLRPMAEKNQNPRTVITPKINIFDRKEEPSFLDLKQTQKTRYNRDFILVDIKLSNNTNRISFIDVRYLSKRFSNCIICILGDIDKLFTYSESLDLRKLVNVVQIKNSNSPQEIVNYIYGCKYFISFASTYTRFAKDKHIKCITLNDDDDIKNIMSRIPKIKGD